MKFAKIENGRLKDPPSMLQNVPRTFPPEEEGGEPITGLYQCGYDPANTPDYVEAFLLSEGWLPVVEAQRPEDGEGYHYIDGYELDGDTIRQAWERVEVPVDPNPEISAERALNIILTGRDSYET